MPTNDKKKDVLDSMQTGLLLSTLTGGDKQEAAPAGRQKSTLEQLLERKLQKELQEEEEREASIRRLKEAQLKQVQAQMAQRKFEQESCNHMKRNGEPRISGQKLSDGTYRLLCLMCQKEFNGTNIPMHLHPNMDLIGGA